MENGLMSFYFEHFPSNIWFGLPIHNPNKHGLSVAEAGEAGEGKSGLISLRSASITLRFINHL